MKRNTLTLIASATLLAVQAHAADPAGSLGAARTVRTVPSAPTPLPTLPKLPDPADLTNPANRLPLPGVGTSIDPRTTVDQRQATLQRPAVPAPSASQGGVGKGGGGAGSGSAWQPPAGGQAGRTPPASLTSDSTLLERQGLNPQPLPPKERAATVRKDLERRGLNPQPLPPKERAAAVRNDLERRGLNPQPLPPREAGPTLQRDSPDAHSAFGGPTQRRLVP